MSLPWHTGLDQPTLQALVSEGLLLVRGSRAWAAFSPSQRELIEEATAQSLAQVGKMTDQVLVQSLKQLDQAAKAIHAEVLKLGDLSQFTGDRLPGKQVELARLKALEKSIQQTGARLKKDLQLVYKGVTQEAATAGIEGVLSKLGALKLPGYKDLPLVDKQDLAAGAFSLVSDQAFDFLTGYQLQLLGKLSDDLVAGTKAAISAGILQGQGPARIARQIGDIVTDPAEFKKAGKTVFRSVQHRAELIARSETMRAYNQGARKFEQQIGVTRLTWLTAGDERLCPECEPLDGREYAIEKFPPQPLHPACRCTHVPAPGSLDQIKDLPAIQEVVTKHTLGQQAVKQALKTGDFSALTVRQLRELAKQKGIPISRSKAYQTQLLADVSGLDVSHLQGLSTAEFKKLLKQHKVSPIKSREDLVKDLLGEGAEKHAAKLAALKQAEKAAKEAAEKAKIAAQKAAEEAKAKQEATEALYSKVGKLVETAKPETFDAYYTAAYEVGAVLENAQKVLSIEALKPFKAQIAKAYDGFLASLKGMKQKQLRDLLKAHGVKNFQWYTKDETLSYILNPEKRPELIAQVAQKLKAVKAKNAAKKAAKPKPVPPEPKAPVIQLANQADQEWEALKDGSTFVFDGDARSLGGAHSKYFFRDANGNRWLFKPIAEEFRAWGDEVAYRIQREIDPNAVEARFIRLEVKGRRLAGSIQRMKTGLKEVSDYGGLGLDTLQAEELLQLQREHVIDWLISNHDSHVNQFLRAQDGKVYGIDKGQLFKFFGKDKLNLTYYPNRVHNAGEPVYNQLLRLHRNGKIQLDLGATEEFIRRAQAITDSAYKEMLRPYAERRFAGQPGALADFLNGAVKRKQTLREDFERLYSEVESARTGKKVTFRFGEKGPAAPAPAAPADAPELTWGRDARFDLSHEVKEIRDNGWQGKSLGIDSDQIEDQNVLVREVLLPGGGKRTMMELRLRPEADQRLTQLLKQQAGHSPSEVYTDNYWHSILNAAKTVNHHLSDLGFNDSTINTMLSHGPELLKLAKAGNVVERKMAAQYLDAMEQIQQKVVAARAGKTPDPLPILKQFQADPKDLKTLSKPVASDPEYTVTVRDRVTADRTRAKGDRLVLEKDNVPLSEFDHRLADQAAEFEVDMGDGIQVVYRPYRSLTQQHLFAVQGRMTVRAAGKVSEARVAQALQKLQKLGLDTTPSTAAQEELMYLQKTAYAANMDQTPLFQQAAARAAEAESTEAAVAVWREAWSSQLGVPDATKLPAYKPQGHYQYSTVRGAGSQGGIRVQERFDLDDKTFQKSMKGHVLVHEITKGDIEEFFEVVLPTNRAFVPTADRFTSGVPIGGMSPGSDMNSGGASYFFTRIKSRRSLGGDQIRFKIDMLKRADAISYPRDLFGRVTGTTVRDNRRSDLAGFKANARSSSNETDFKGPVTILDNLDSIGVRSPLKRDRLLKTFRKNGITALPDGRPIEDVIVVAN